MKKHFAHYYQLTSDELSGVLDSSLIALDANVLLDLYRYSAPTRRDFIRILRKLRPRLWLPHQAGQEFHANRLQVIKEGAAKVNEADKSLATLRAALDAINRTPGETTGIQPPASLTKAYSILEGHLRKTRAQAIRPTLLMSADPIWTAITELFHGRVGDPYDDARLAELYKDGARRYQDRRPPGFEDDKKPDPARYGDVILWRQILDQAKSAARPVVLITSDSKSDWWLIQDGETMGPRPELREEMLSEAGQLWHMYKPGLFMDVMGKRLDVPASQPALEEVRTLTDRQPDLRQDDALVRESYRGTLRGTLDEMAAASDRANALGAYARGLD